MGVGDRVVELEAENAELRGVVARLEARVVELERELSRDSGNSGRAPSGDTLPQRAAQVEERLSRAERRQRARAKELMRGGEPERRPGKQPGEEGKTLEMVAMPDLLETHVPQGCSGCGASLAGAPVVGVERRQVFDLPEVRALVTEHRAESRRCACGATTAGAFPPAARGPACWGPRVRALACYLMVRQHLPVARAAELLADVLGAPVSTGWLAGIAAEGAAGLDGFLAEVRRQVGEADVAHFDETGARIAGARWWFHVASTDLLTLLDCHPRRGVATFDDIGVLAAFAGIAVHDGWKPYWHYTCSHSLCGAHLLRDLAGVAEVESQRPWAEGMAAGQAGLSRGQLKTFWRCYSLLVKAGYAANPEPAGRTRDALERASYNLLRRLDTQRDDVQRSWIDPRVPFDNNQAERDVRMVKLQQEISGCFRTPEGAKAFCAVRSYLQTAAKHGVNLLEALQRPFTTRRSGSRSA